MKFFGKLKPFLVPILLGVLGAWIYSKFVQDRLPAKLQ